MLRLVLLDGQNLAHRLIHRAGLPTGGSQPPVSGVLAFVRELDRILALLRPTHAVAAWDTPRAAYVRRKWWPGYKAARDDHTAVPAVTSQVAAIRRVLEVSGMPLVTSPGWEADDVVATCAARFGRGFDIRIVARDKDYHQIVTPSCLLFDGEYTVGPREVRDHWGVEPGQVLEVQTLAGDPTDGVPGVEGVGIKRAAEYVRTYGSADRACSAARTSAKFTPKAAKALRAFDADLGRKLVRLRPDVPLVAEPPVEGLGDLKFDGLHYEKIDAVLAEIGITSWRSRQPELGTPL